MVPGAVVELDRDADEWLAGAQLQLRHDLDLGRRGGPRAAGPFDVERPVVPAHDDQVAHERSGRAARDDHVAGRLDERIDRRRAVVVAVAEVAAVDEAPDADELGARAADAEQPIVTDGRLDEAVRQRAIRDHDRRLVATR